MTYTRAFPSKQKFHICYCFCSGWFGSQLIHPAAISSFSGWPVTLEAPKFFGPKREVDGSGQFQDVHSTPRKICPSKKGRINKSVRTCSKNTTTTYGSVGSCPPPSAQTVSPLKKRISFFFLESKGGSEFPLLDLLFGVEMCDSILAQNRSPSKGEERWRCLISLF